MKESLVNQIIAAVMPQLPAGYPVGEQEIADRLAAVNVSDDTVFGGLASLNTSPKRLVAPTIYVAFQGGTYAGFHNLWNDEGAISIFGSSPDPLVWGKMTVYSPTDEEFADIEQRLDALEGTDLSLVGPDGAPVDKPSTANCYIVRKTGRYRIPLVYGNAIKNGVANTAAYTRQGTTYTADFVNHLGNLITSPCIQENAGCKLESAGLLWQTSKGMVSMVTLQGNFLIFDVADVPATNGLAVLYVKDANGDIAWSWTIWATTDDLSTVKLTNHTEVDYNMMPEGLGAIWSADRAHYVTPHYQWGRKDPFCPPTAYNSTTNMTLYDIAGNTVSVSSYGVADDSDAGGSVRSVANAIKMPDKFFLEYDATNYNWNNLEWFNNFWNAAITTQNDNDDNQDSAIKTIYDPCPVGWIMPGARFATGFTTSGSNVSSDAPTGCEVIGTFANGWTFKKNATDTEGFFIPAAGNRSRTSGGLYNVGSSGLWWAFAPSSETSARNLYFYSTAVNPLSTSYRASGYAVLPSRE